MATNFPTGFAITGAEPIDTRLVLSKAEMAALKKAKMPQVYFAICKDDGCLYLYNSENESTSETGRFRLFKATGGTIDDILISSDEDNILELDENGVLKVISPGPIEQEQILSLFQKEEK